MGTKQRDLKKAFKLAIRPLYIPCSFQEFCEALPNFTPAEHQRLHGLFTQVMTSLYGNVEDEFQNICLETQVGAALDTVEQLVEEQSLDPLFSDKTNVMDVSDNLSRTTKEEIQYLTEMLEKAEAQNHHKRVRIESLKKARPDMSEMATAVQKLRSGISSYDVTAMESTTHDP